MYCFRSKPAYILPRSRCQLSKTIHRRTTTRRTPRWGSTRTLPRRIDEIRLRNGTPSTIFSLQVPWTHNRSNGSWGRNITKMKEKGTYFLRRFTICFQNHCLEVYGKVLESTTFSILRWHCSKWFHWVVSIISIFF